MTGPIFVDTNVLVCARDASAGAKHEAARAWVEHLWRSREGRISYQVLQEFYVTVTAKLRPGMDRAAARNDVRGLAAWRPVQTNMPLLEGAWLVQDRHGLSWWDALIVSAARAAECHYLLSEDLQEGQDLEGVRVLNPFRSAPGEVA